MANLLERIAVSYLEKRMRRIKLPGVKSSLPTSDYDISSLSISAVWAAVTLISGHLSSVPLNLYRRLPNGGREKAVKTPLYTVLHNEPYPGLTSVEFREAVWANIETYGVGYIEVGILNGKLALRPHNSLFVVPRKEKKVFEIVNEKNRAVPADRMIVIPSFTFDGNNPIHLVEKRKRSMSLAVSYEERAAAFNKNGSIPAGVAIWGPGYNKLNEEGKERIEKKWAELFQGISNQGGTAFMPEGSDFKPISFNPEQLQMLTSRQHSVQEIARWFRVPPHKIGDLSRATFSNIEHQAIEYVQDSLLPRAKKLEAILTLALIEPGKRDEYFIEHNLDGLQRGDFNTRMQGYATAKQWGWMTTNEIRALENMNPVPDNQAGNILLVPLNMVPANQIGSSLRSDVRMIRTKQDISQFRSATTARRNITNAYAPVFERTQKTITNIEVEEVRTAAEEHLPQNLPGFLNFLEAFYSENDFTPRIRNMVSGVIVDYAGQIGPAALEEIGVEPTEGMIDTQITDYIDNFAYRHANSGKKQLKKIAQEASADDERDALDDVNTRLDEWKEKQPGKMRQNEPIRAEGAFSRAAWAFAGVTKLVWVTYGESCPFCNMLAGKIIGIQSNFVGKGEEVRPEGEEPLIPNSNIGHPGLHEGCDCGVAAVVGG